MKHSILGQGENPKICIVCFWDRAATPYLEKYERVMLEMGIVFDILFWDRGNCIKGTPRANERYVHLKIAKHQSLKIFSFLKWGQLVRRMLRRSGYEHLVILSTYPGVVLSRFLKKNYRNRYIFDIRDYSMEEHKPFRSLVMKIIESSAFAAISSHAYLRWLDNSARIFVNHNITGTSTGLAREHILRREKPLVISFVGTIRLDDHAKAFMLNLKDNDKYIMEFVGRMTPECDIERFCRENAIHNVKFRGVFTNNEKPNIYRKVDLVNSVYANKRPADITPLPNRIYDAAIYKAPIICSSGTYVSELAQKYGIGFSVDAFDPRLVEKLDAYVDGFDESLFVQGCEKFMMDIMKEEKVFLEKLSSTLKGWQ